MQRIVSRWSAAALVIGLGLTSAVASGASTADTPLALKVSSPDLKWGPCPAIFPAGCKIAVLHGDPSQPNADIYLRVPGGYTIPTHSHTSAERMVLVTGKLKVQYKGSKMTPLNVAEYAFGPAGLPHVAKCVSKTPCTLFIAFI